MAEIRAGWLSFCADHVEPVSREIFLHVEKMIIGTLIVSAGPKVNWHTAYQIAMTICYVAPSVRLVQLILAFCGE